MRVKTTSNKKGCRQEDVDYFSKELINLGDLYRSLSYKEKAAKLAPFAQEVFTGKLEFLCFFLVAKALLGRHQVVEYAKEHFPGNFLKDLAVKYEAPELQKYKADPELSPYFLALGVPLEEAA